MAYGQAADYGELRAMVASIVAEMLGGGGSSSWVARGSQVTPRLYAQTRDQEGPSGADQFFGAVGQLGRLGNLVSNYYEWDAKNILVQNKIPTSILNYGLSKDQLKAILPEGAKEAANSWVTSQKFANWGGALGGLAGVYGAYKSGDPISGAMSGLQLGNALGPSGAKLFGKGAGWIGAALGLLAGLFGGPEEVDRWDRPKFRKADKAYDKLFTFDRGEEDEYYMPDSFYFRTGWRGARKIVVRIGNNQFDDHIRDSLTNSYATQLQRGLVF